MNGLRKTKLAVFYLSHVYYKVIFKIMKHSASLQDVGKNFNLLSL